MDGQKKARCNGSGPLRNQKEKPWNILLDKGRAYPIGDSVNQHAAINIERDAGAITGQIAGKEHNRAGDIVRPAQPR